MTFLFSSDVKPEYFPRKISFCKHYKCPKTLIISLNHNISNLSVLKYFKVVIDNTLSWLPQIQNLKQFLYGEFNVESTRVTCVNSVNFVLAINGHDFQNSYQ